MRQVLNQIGCTIRNGTRDKVGAGGALFPGGGSITVIGNVRTVSGDIINAITNSGKDIVVIDVFVPIEVGGITNVIGNGIGETGAGTETTRSLLGKKEILEGLDSSGIVLKLRDIIKGHKNTGLTVGDGLSS